MGRGVLAGRGWRTRWVESQDHQGREQRLGGRGIEAQSGDALAVDDDGPATWS